VVLSQETLTERVAVDERTFDQEPRAMRLRAGAWEIGLGADEPELDWLRDWVAAHGFAPRAADESDLDFALRSARFVQATLQFGGGEISSVRRWSPRLLIERAEQGERFFCDSYARLLASMLVSHQVPARAVWMDGHVTSEVWIAALHRWVLVDAMYNMTARGDDGPLSVMQLRERLKHHQPVAVEPISDPTSIDEPSRTSLDGDPHSVFLRGMFAVIDSEVEFASASQHVFLPIMSLKTPDMPEGTMPWVRLMRWAAPTFLLIGALMVAVGRRGPELA
ncbi:MAG TPA: hypothetical protein VMQ62_06255, partial [Dongiaceae bacterium]|nr:hypothetical protein [Dongiaceae bacterium]